MDPRFKSDNGLHYKPPLYLHSENSVSNPHIFMPCSHVTEVSQQMEYPDDTPIKTLRPGRKDAREKQASTVSDNHHYLGLRPMSQDLPKHKALVENHRLNRAEAYSSHQANYSSEQALQAKIAQLSRQLENEKSINRYNTDKITALTVEISGNRSQMKAMKSDMERMRQSFQNEINQLRKEAADRKSFQSIKRSEQHMVNTVRMHPSKEEPLQETAIRKKAGQTTQRGHSIQSIEKLQRKQPPIALAGRPRCMSSHDPHQQHRLIKDISLIAPQRRPHYFLDQPKPAHHAFFNTTQYWMHPQQPAHLIING